MPETTTHVGAFWTRDGQPRQRANVIGMGEAGKIVTRANQPLIDEVLAYRRNHTAIFDDAGKIVGWRDVSVKDGPLDANPDANYYHS